jgi:hypothetical protein
MEYQLLFNVKDLSPYHSESELNSWASSFQSGENDDDQVMIGPQVSSHNQENILWTRPKSDLQLIPDTAFWVQIRRSQYFGHNFLIWDPN